MKLEPPWDADVAALNAQFVIERGYLEGRSSAIWCPTCAGEKRRLLRVFRGPDSNGRLRSWFWVPTYSVMGVGAPQLCRPAPGPGEPWSPMHGICSRCLAGIMILADSPEIAAWRQVADDRFIVVRPGRPMGDEMSAGDAVLTFRGGGRWQRGPLSSWVVWLDTPTLGEMQP